MTKHNLINSEATPLPSAGPGRSEPLPLVDPGPARIQSLVEAGPLGAVGAHPAEWLSRALESYGRLILAVDPELKKFTRAIAAAAAAPAAGGSAAVLLLLLAFGERGTCH